MKHRVAIMIALLVSAFVAIGPTIRAEDDIILQDGTILTSSIAGRTITVPVGAQVQYAGDITMTATQDINIEGRLSGQSLDGHAFSILLSAARTVRVTGSIVSANGLDGAAATGEAFPVGGAGTAGGAITVEWGPLDQFVLADGSYIKSGNGGNGGNANVTATSTSPSAVTARGGNGGAGGSITLNGATALLYGQIILGNGGKGGDVAAWVPATSSTAQGGYANLTGGDGGPAGDLTLPPGTNLLTLYNSGQVTGGEGGSGGSGTAQGEAAATSRSCGEDGYHSSSDSATRNGVDGCRGYSPYVEGGKGARGLIGGWGGNAYDIYGGNGGPGGSGAHGEADDRGYPYCALYTIGGNAANGGDGGYSSAKGGDGGQGTLIGGNGGNATAYGGNGGNQGHAGNGGRTAWRCDGWVNVCYLQNACWEASNNYGCGHVGGMFSNRGIGGDYSATPGRGGDGVLILDGVSGTASGARGANGADGDPGDYPAQCVHSGSHAHW